MGAKEPTVRARELGIALRRAVRAADMDNNEVAHRLGWSPSKVSNLFGGWRGASEVDVAMILALCGIRSPRRDHLLKLFMDEYTLVRTGSGSDAMSEQLHHLLRMSVRPYVEIRVIPEAVGFHAGTTPFHLMEFTELNPVVHVEDLTSVLFFERTSTTKVYRSIAARLNKVALTEGQSREWIARLANALGAPREEQDDPVGADDPDLA